MKFPWLQDSIDQWGALISSDRVPHAILLSGSKGLGKFDLAKNMAHMALCENLSTTGPCLHCSACHLYSSQNHPDFTIITAEKSVIKVDQVRKLTKKIMLSSTKGQYKVVIVDNAEQMNKSAANALLKTLEEPPERVVVMLVTPEVGRLLPTIRSRCVKINLVAPPYHVAYEWVKNNTQSHADDINFSLSLTNGSPIFARIILENEWLLQVQSMIEDLKLLAHHQKNILEVSKRWNTEEFYLHFPMLVSYFLAIIKQNNNINFENSSTQIDMDLSHINHLNDKLLVFVRGLYQFIHRSETALKKELLLDELLINWKNNFQSI